MTDCWDRFKTVTLDEFRAFIKAYPRRLVPDRCGIGIPEVITYNDFMLDGGWPECAVAAYDEDYLTDEPMNFRVRIDL